MPNERIDALFRQPVCWLTTTARRMTSPSAAASVWRAIFPESRFPSVPMTFP